MDIIHFLQNQTLLFEKMNDEDIKTMLSCLNANELFFEKDSFILRRGEPFEKLGIVLEGTMLITREDEEGNCFVLTQVSQGQIFGMSFAGGFNPDISITAGTDAKALIMQTDKIFSICARECECHMKFMLNLYTCMAKKNVELTRKVFHISQRTLRKKIMSYLCEQTELCSSNSFYIPFDRQQLADYLASDRSALSAELSKMKKDGIIDYRKNHFTVIKKI